MKVTGCGLTALRWPLTLGGALYVFDSATGLLLGAGRYDDVHSTLGGCKDSAFQAGEGPPLPEELNPDPGVALPHRRRCTTVLVETL